MSKKEEIQNILNGMGIGISYTLEISENEPQFRKLLRNTSHAIKEFGIEKFNRILSNLLKTKTTNQLDDFNLVTTIVATEFGYCAEDLQKKYIKTEMYDAKMVCIKILNSVFNIKARTLASSYYNTFPNSIINALKKFDNLDPEKIKDHKKIYDKYMVCIAKVTQEINKN